MMYVECAQRDDCPSPRSSTSYKPACTGLADLARPAQRRRQFTEAELRAAHFAAMQNEADSEEGNIEMRAEGKAALAWTLTEAELRAAHDEAMRASIDPAELALEITEGEAALVEHPLILELPADRSRV